jgi:hypothetical protein
LGRRVVVVRFRQEDAKDAARTSQSIVTRLESGLTLPSTSTLLLPRELISVPCGLRAL